VNEPRLHLLPSEPPRPLTSRIPWGQALRWHSPYEGAGPAAAVAVFLTQKSFVRACAHAGSDLHNEVGGALVGKWRVDEARGEKFVVVEGALPAPYTRHGSSFVTFTQDSLVALHEQLEQRHPGKQMVGWYHTHPGLGLFLSGYDAWLHEHFFPELWQVALVIDPQARQGGFFVRTEEGALDPQRYFGFSELLDGRRRSLVHWENVQPDPEPAVVGG